MIKQLFGNQVAIKPLLEEEKTVSGIVIPGKKGTQKQIGTVIAAGKGLMLTDGTRAPMDIKAGMTVIYRQYSGVTITDEGENVLVMDASDVIAEV